MFGRTFENVILARDRNLDRPNLKYDLFSSPWFFASIIMPKGLERLKAARRLLIKVHKDANNPGYGIKVRDKEAEFTRRPSVRRKIL